jgi:hypothetical protein
MGIRADGLLQQFRLKRIRGNDVDGRVIKWVRERLVKTDLTHKPSPRLGTLSSGLIFDAVNYIGVDMADRLSPETWIRSNAARAVVKSIRQCHISEP